MHHAMLCSYPPCYATVLMLWMLSSGHRLIRSAALHNAMHVCVGIFMPCSAAQSVHVCVCVCVGEYTTTGAMLRPLIHTKIKPWDAFCKDPHTKVTTQHSTTPSEALHGTSMLPALICWQPSCCACCAMHPLLFFIAHAVHAALCPQSAFATIHTMYSAVIHAVW